jgi:hypothetical protein
MLISARADFIGGRNINIVFHRLIYMTNVQLENEIDCKY